MDNVHIESIFGPRIDGAVDKVSDLLPAEQSMELRTALRQVVDEAVAAGWISGIKVDAEQVHADA